MAAIGQGVEICTSTTRPSSPVVGTMIYETDTASYRWCTAVSPSITWLGLTPSGTIQPFAGITTPTGWLLCAGQDVSRTTYADLFASLRTAFTGATTTNASTTVSGLSGMSSTTHVGWGIAGSGIPTGATISSVTNATTVVISANATSTQSGTASLVISPYGFTGANNTTTFLLPDFRGRVAAGLDNMNGSAASRLTSTVLNASNALGAVGGAQTHTLTTAQIPSHNHNLNWDTGRLDIANTYNGAGGIGIMTNNANYGATTRNTVSTGSDNAHTNTQPTLVVNYIIKI